MTIALRSDQHNTGNTLTMPTHATGDLLLAFATRDNSTVAPTLPTGWTALFSIGSGTGAVLIAYKYAQSNAETFGTWTNASHVAVTVWYGAANTIVWPWLLSTNTATSGTMTWPAQTAGTFRTSSADNALVAWGHNRSSTNNLGLTLGALTNLFAEGDGSTYQVCVKYQLTRTTAWSATSLGLAASVFYRTAMLCLTEQAVYGSTGGGGSVRQVNIRGGADQ